MSVFALALLVLAPQDRVEERRAGTAVMLHRGSADLAVENTLAACEASFLHGADGLEIDIRRTRDGVLVLMHDPWIDRVLDAHGNVADWSYDELLLCRFREPYGFTRPDERIPTVREALELTRTYDGLLHLDIKIPGADRELLDLLDTMKLLPNVVRVNPFNDAALKAEERVRQIPSQGAIIHGNNDYDPKAVQANLDRPKKGTFLVDDPRAAATLLGRPIREDRTLRFNPPLPRCAETAKELLTTTKLPRRQALARLILHYPEVARERLLSMAKEQPPEHQTDWIWALGKLAARDGKPSSELRQFLKEREGLPSLNPARLAIEWEASGEAGVPVEPKSIWSILEVLKAPASLADPKANTRGAADLIRFRAVVIREARRARLKDTQVIEALRDAVQNRSYHLNGAWQGLDGAEAIRSLAALDPKGNVGVFREAVLRIDSALEPITKHEEHPWWLRRTASWWDFRVKTEALRALGQVGTAEAAEVLWSFLALPPKKAESFWRELYWDSARALCSGAYALTANDLNKLFRHTHSSVRRTASVYLIRQYQPEYHPVLDEFIPWAKGWVKK